MAFSVPRNVPSFSNPQRKLEDQLWASSGMSSRSTTRGSALLHNVQDRVENLLEGGGRLPMYKDKPYTYAASRRMRPLWRRRRVMAFLGVVLLLAVMYYNGAFSREREGRASVWSWKSLTEAPRGRVDWEKRREHVARAFEQSWDAYERYAWGYDEYHPVSKGRRNMAPKGLGWIIIDSLDTMMIMNQTERLSHAREWLQNTLTWDQDQDVNTFETTIRMLGGLLSAHYLSTEFPNMAPVAKDAGGEDLYLEKAKDLADRLMVAFDSDSGIPFASVNLGTLQPIPSHADNGASSTAETATLQLEFKYLAKLTGEKFYWDKVEKVIKVIDDNGAEDGLVPIYIYPDSGKFKGRNVRLGSRGDSYYEYLIKQYLQTNKAEPIYEEMWDQALEGVRRHLITYTEPSGFTIIAERPEGLDAPLSPKMDHLVCFMPGTIALAATGGLPLSEARKLATWSRKDEEDIKLAAELTHTCWATYKYMATGLAAEITHFNVGKPPLSEGAAHPTPPSVLSSSDADAPWRADFIVKPADVHNLQRPETVESLFYMWRITGDVKYREWGWEMFMSFMEHTAVEGGGFTSLTNANKVPPVTRDNMESFWLAETLKYFYLLFSPDDLLPLDKVVFNTEAHPLPRFEMGRLFSTGWERKPRDRFGRIIKKEEVSAEDKPSKEGE
ncbi:Glycosyl hydrolase family 47 [Scedosporium apiospermum]|uniref:alpha-1,2-Mannosidase n=1 Tax=Pseudallescheria apiosperma TaxID=563466 RepID=A0A084GAA7_PSEDA|nr:Glycosyl hydrolase family 47 [Scedosporium apiospermum]KEZ44269.1 Glycosyl hydrolase family 47 [Scedosporium apiospermum]